LIRILLVVFALSGRNDDVKYITSVSCIPMFPDNTKSKMVNINETLPIIGSLNMIILF